MNARARQSAKKRAGCGCLTIIGIVLGVVLFTLVGVALFSTPGEDVTAASPGTPAGGEIAASPPSGSDTETAVFGSTVDGDTIKTDLGTVRIIGIDTPERGECGYGDAAAAISALLASGDPVTLQLPSGQRDTDRHKRLLRYVFTSDGVDIGLMQIESGNAVARYDSNDGYPRHPKQAEYRAAQRASLDSDGSVHTPVCALPPAATEAPASPEKPGTPDTQAAWWTQYPSCAALQRNTVGHPKGPFNQADPAQAELYQWFAFGTGNRGDGDGDGLACE